MKITSLAWTAAALIALGGMAQAQTVSGGDAYNQGYAAGAAAKQQNSFSAYQDGLAAGQTDPSAQSQAFDNGYQAGVTQQQQSNSQQAYNNGYQDRASEDQKAYASEKAYSQGYNEGANDQAHLDGNYP